MSESRSLFVRLFVAVLVTVLAIWISFVVAIVDSGRREEAQRADAIGLQYSQVSRIEAFNIGSGKSATIAVYRSGAPR